MTKVLFLIDSVGPHAGTENQLLALVARLDRQRCQPYLACLADSPRLAEVALPVHHKKVFPVSRIWSAEGWRQGSQLRRFLREEQIDILHTFMVKSTLLGVTAARGTGCAILTSRRNAGHWLTPGYRLIFRWINRQTTRVLANSEGARRAAVELEGLPADRIDVLYNGVDLSAGLGRAEICREQLHLPGGAPVVGLLANYRPVKDPGLFLQAAQLVAQRHPSAVFLLAGQGELKEQLVLQAESAGIRERVYFTDGRLAVPDVLACLDVACLTSRAEGFSNAILEYMSAGLPVVATDVGGVAEAVRENETGYIVERTPEALAEKILDLLHDPGKRTRLGQAGRRRCVEIFGMERCVRNYEDYYDAIAARYARRPAASQSR